MAGRGSLCIGNVVDRGSGFRDVYLVFSCLYFNQSSVQIPSAWQLKWGPVQAQARETRGRLSTSLAL